MGGDYGMNLIRNISEMYDSGDGHVQILAGRQTNFRDLPKANIDQIRRR